MAHIGATRGWNVTFGKSDRQRVNPAGSCCIQYVQGTAFIVDMLISLDRVSLELPSTKISDQKLSNQGSLIQ